MASLFHRTVVDDVIRNMRVDFASEGLDEQALDDLKQLWESKLIQVGAYDYPTNMPQQNYYPTNTDYSYSDHTSHAPPSNLLPMTQNPMYTTHTTSTMNYLGTNAPRSAAHMAAMNALRSLNTPSNTLQPTSLQTSYAFDPSGKPQQYMAPPPNLNAWNPQPNTNSTLNTQYINNNIKQLDGASDEVDSTLQERKKIDKILLKKFEKVQKQKQRQLQKQNKPTETIPQFDGLGDRKTEDDEFDDDDDDDDEAKGDEELNSDLDESDEEPDTEHIVLCQYEKVTRVKNKRKANLKDGIMHINGKDYIFSKANGEFDW